MELLNNYFVGILNNNSEFYFSELITDNINGNGKLYISNDKVKCSYNGPILNSKMNGQGLIIYSYHENLYKSYKGGFSNNEFNGEGTITYTNGDMFIGNFVNGKKNGSGKMYNPNGNIIVDNIWINDIICGIYDFIDYYHNTKIPKIIGKYCDSIKIKDWIYIRQDNTISIINYYKNIIINEAKESTLKALLSENLITHNTGYLQKQYLKLDNNITDDILCLGDFKYFDIKLMYDNKMILNVNKNIDEFNYPDMFEYAIAIDQSDIKNNSMFLYLDSNGKKIKITKFIDGVEYDKILYLAQDLKIHIDKCINFIVYNFIRDKFNNIIIKPSIYQINSDFKHPTLYYEGDINSEYQPNGNGIIYMSGNTIKMSGSFINGQITKGILFGEHKNNLYIVYEGTFKDNLPNGEGTFENHFGDKIYEGQVLNSKRDGDGISYYPNGLIHWKGAWKVDKMHGKGTLYGDEGSLIGDCTYINGEFADFS